MNTRLNHVQDWLSLALEANWSVERLAELCGVSGRTLRRYFLKIMGKPPKVWLAEQRQGLGIKLLQAGFSVKETASQLGYQHPGTFSRVFKKTCGECPGKVLASHQKKPFIRQLSAKA